MREPVQLRSNEAAFISGWGAKPLVATAVAGAVAIGGASLRTSEFSVKLQTSWLLSCWFAISISLGGLFFVAIQHLTRAGWSVTVRRISESIAALISAPMLLLLPLVVVLLSGNSELYLWNDSELVDNDSILAGKRVYLNAPFFAVRYLLYVLVWGGASLWLLRSSRKQDEGGHSWVTLLMERRSAPILLALALTTTFASFDWLMSLDPYWFSTIFGVYLFAGSMVGFLAVLAILVASWVRTQRHSSYVSSEQLHDVVKLLYGFNCFWAYIAFSQYLLIWYANIPEETVWLKHRQTHGWEAVTIGLAVLHFVVPFVLLMSRRSKRRPLLVIAVSVMLLIAHWGDLYWIVYPQFTEQPAAGVIEISALLVVASFSLLVGRRLVGTHPVIAVGDPRLEEAVHHHVA